MEKPVELWNDVVDFLEVAWKEPIPKL